MSEGRRLLQRVRERLESQGVAMKRSGESWMVMTAMGMGMQLAARVRKSMSVWERQLSQKGSLRIVVSDARLRRGSAQSAMASRSERFRHSVRKPVRSREV